MSRITPWECIFTCTWSGLYLQSSLHSYNQLWLYWTFKIVVRVLHLNLNNAYVVQPRLSKLDGTRQKCSDNWEFWGFTVYIFLRGISNLPPVLPFTTTLLVWDDLCILRVWWNASTCKSDSGMQSSVNIGWHMLLKCTFSLDRAGILWAFLLYWHLRWGFY